MAGQKYVNNERGRTRFDQARLDSVSAINQRCRELGIGMSPMIFERARDETIINMLFGKIEMEETEDGQIITTDSHGDRMDFEMEVLKRVLEIVNTEGVAASMAPNTPRAQASPSGLVLPGGFQ